MADASPLLRPHPPPGGKPPPAASRFARCSSHAHDELRSFRACLAWLCVDHSPSRGLAAAGSWAVFLLLAVAAPAAARLLHAPPRPYDGQVQVSLTLAASLAYVSLRAILRMVGFAREFGRFADVATVLQHHRRIREQLRKISHRYRKFIVCSLILVSASQFAALLSATRPHAVVNLATAGDLVLCSLSLVAGLLVCLHSAAKITHKTQAMTSVAAAWHADATVHAFDNDQEDPDPDLPPTAGYLAPDNAYRVAAGDESGDDDDDSHSETSSLDDPKYVPFQANNICFQKRQALVTYLENNRAGITVYGFVVDRAWLHALFMIEFSLVMWLLGKTVGIS
ncbi:uncharacterized protein C2845_PM12G17800 [Panicum miliaceum]|uniref:Uncharacterized protein n=1 Tax=Panicum miliaceum TaxID=4540 RepID=A0A3L6QAU8_PANMI|nr:uncharacterized protein C2845_PM12G17800 [Panicum miliaceum]